MSSYAQRRCGCGSRPSRRVEAIEPLERRTMLSTIVWTNRTVSDNFTAVYGLMASTARAVVDRALADWGRVISNFNYGNGSNTYNVTIVAADLGGGGRGLTNNIGTTNGKPSSATITLDDDGGGAGWYFDPTPGTSTLPDDSEFTSLITKFTANGPNSLFGNDFYRTITHELGHAMGIYIGGSGSIPATNTGITDPDDSSAQIWKYVAPSGTYTYTDNGGGHVFEGPAVGGLPTYPNDLMNAGRTVGYPPPTRELITDDDALMLRDAHGYTINLPSTLNTFLTNFNTSTGAVTLNEDPDTGNDTVNVATSGVSTVFNVDGFSETIPSGSIFSIPVNMQTGINNITIASCPAGNPVTINALGVNFVTIGGAITGAQGVLSSVTVTGAGLTSMIVDDSGDSGARTFTMDNNGTTATVTGLAPGTIAWPQASVVNVTLSAGAAADTFNLLRTTENVFYDGTGGNDAINIGNGTNGVQSIVGDLQLSNTASFSVVSINDAGDSAPRTVTHDTTTHGGANYGHVTGLAPGDIDYKYADTSSVTLKTGSGVDTVNVLRAGNPLNLDSAGGNDVVNIGSSGAGGVQGIAAQVTVDNAPAYTVLTIDDAGDSTPRTVTLDESGGYNTLAGLAPALVRFDSADTLTTTLRTGSAADTVNVVRNDDVLTVTSAGGLDAVNIGNPAASGVQGITGPLTVTNPPSFTTLTIDDTGDSTARNATMDTSSGVSTISGFAPATIGFNTSDVSNSGGVSVTTGSGADSFTVHASSNPLKFSSANGTDLITLGNAADGARDVLGSVNVINPPAHSNIVIDDAADTAARSVAITAGSVTGLAVGAVTWTNFDVSTVTLDGGSGGNTFTATLFSNVTTVNAGSGSDAVVLNSNAGGFLTLNGQGGVDSLTVNDTAAAAQTYNLTATTLARGTLNVTYGTLETINLNASTAADTFNVNGTAAGSSVVVNANSGTDAINVNETAPGTAVTILPSAGNDNVNVNTDNAGSAAATFSATMTLGTLAVGAGGTGTVRAGGTRTLYVASLVMTGGRVDVNDNSLVVDPGSLATVRGLLQTGYAGGAWNGVGIISSAAAADAQHLHALGYFAAGDLDLLAYNGQSVSPSAVIVKYTLAGDANMDGAITRDDFALIDKGKAKALGQWIFGDFDYSGGVTAADYAIIDHSAVTLGLPPDPSYLALAGADVPPIAAADTSQGVTSAAPATAAPPPTKKPAAKPKKPGAKHVKPPVKKPGRHAFKAGSAGK